MESGDYVRLKWTRPDGLTGLGNERPEVGTPNPLAVARGAPNSQGTVMTNLALTRFFATASFIMSLALAGCEFERTAEAEPANRVIPKELCAQLEATVADVRKKTGMEFEGDEAIIEDAAWRAMSETQDRLAQALAYRLACAAEVPPAEQSVTIRNELGAVLTRQVVTIELREEDEDSANSS